MSCNKESLTVSYPKLRLEGIICSYEKLLSDCRPVLNGEIYLTDIELSKRLSTSRRTLQEWRNSGKIGYIKLEGKILYAESDVQKLLDKNYRKEWNY